MTSMPDVLPSDTAAIARRFKGTSNVAMVRMPRLVVGSFQRCSVNRPMPKRMAVTVVKMRNFNTGICEIWAHRLTTRAVEQPIIKRPPMISPQRILLSSMKDWSTSVNGRRWRRGGTISFCSGVSADRITTSVVIDTATGSATVSFSALRKDVGATYAGLTIGGSVLTSIGDSLGCSTGGALGVG